MKGRAEIMAQRQEGDAVSGAGHVRGGSQRTRKCQCQLLGLQLVGVGAARGMDPAPECEGVEW